MRKTVCLLFLFLLFSLSFGSIDTLKYSKQYGLGWAADGVFTPDETGIIISSADGVIRHYDMQMNKTKEYTDGLGLYLGKPACSFDGKNFITASDEYLTIWDEEAGEQVKKFKAHSNWMPHITYSSDNTKIMTYSPGGKGDEYAPMVKMWDATTGTLLKSTKIENQSLNAILSPSTEYLLVQGQSNEDSVKHCYKGNLVSFPGGIPVMEFGDYQSGIFSTDGSHIAIRDSEGAVIVRSLSADSELFELEKGGELSHFSADNSKIFTYSNSTDSVCIYTHDAKTGSLLTTTTVETGYYTFSISISPTGKYAFINTWEKNPLLVDIVTGKSTYFDEYTPISNCAALIPEKSLAIMGGGDGNIHLFDLESAELKHTLRGHQQVIRSLQLTANNTRLVSTGDSSVVLWGLESKTPLQSWNVNGAVYNASLTPDGTKVLIAYTLEDSMRIELRYTSADVTMHSFTVPKSGNLWLKSTVKLSEDGARIGAVSGNSVYIWDAETGIKVATYVADSMDTPIDFDFASDGRKIVVCGGPFYVVDTGTTAYLWNIETQQVEQRYKDIKYDMLSIALSADDSKLLIGSWQEVVLYETKTGKAINRYLSQGRDVGFSNDGKLAYSTGTCFRLWNSEVTAIVHPEAKGSGMSQVRISRVDATGLQLFLPNAVEKGSIEIYQANGRQLINSGLQAGRIAFDRPLAAGLYLYQIKTGAQTVVSGRFQIK